MAEHQLARRPHPDFVAEPSEMGFFAGIRRYLRLVNATSPRMLLAATALTPLPLPSQNCISALIVQVGATGAAEQQAELSLAGRGWFQERFIREKVLPASASN